MIDAKSLRIGNWVNFMEDDTRFQVTEINPTGISVENSDESTWIELDQFSGIKLSQEIIISCGFSKDEDLTTPNLVVYYIYLPMGSVFVGIYQNNFSFYFGAFGSYSVKIMFLHQLQNLYFDLTNKELEITL